MEIWQIILLTFVGMLSGWLNVMAGGGSLLSVPVMLFMDIPAPVANGTNRIAILAQNITAVYTFFRKGFSDFKLSLSLSLAACIGAVGGAWLGVQIDGVWFDRLLAAVMIGQLVGWQFFWYVDQHTQTLDESTSVIAYAFILVGIAGFLFQLIFTGRIHRALGVGVGMRVLPGTVFSLSSRSWSRPSP